jgi:hypothetical protein
MSEIDPDHRDQVEESLGRHLTDEELRRVDSLGALTGHHIAVIAIIHPRNRIASLLYVGSVVRSTRWDDVMKLLDAIEYFYGERLARSA